MSVDVSAVARVLGITTTFKDLRGGSVLFLPQSIMLLAQGQTGVTFPSTKWLATGAGAAGAKYGYRSPIYLALRELLPVNGDGVGTIPINVYPLGDHGSGAAAAGDITPSGTATVAASYRVRIGGYLSDAFTLGAWNLATVANLHETLARMRDAIESVLHMPCNSTFTYGTVTSAPKSGGNTGNGTCTALSVTGVPRPGVWQLRFTTAVANGGVAKLTDSAGTVISSSVTMTPGAGGATVINEGGLQFTLTDGATDFIVGDGFDITVPATDLQLTVAWKGPTGNDVKVEVLDELGDLTFAITQPTGGLNNPSITDALGQVGNVWETMLLNGLNVEDTTALDEIQTFGDGRWGTLVHKPLVAFVGNTETVKDDAVAVSSVRRTDRINAQLVAPGSPNLPIAVAARQLARIAKVANNNPPTNYSSQRVTGITPGTDGEQWDYTQRDQAVKAGSSTVQVVDGVIQIDDVMTFYRPTGEEPPAYRYVCDIVKLQNIVFNANLIFAADSWAGAPLIPDDQVTANPLAKKPKMAKAALAGLLDALALQALISDPEGAKSTIFATIDSMNPKRLNVGFTAAISGNSQIISVDFSWGFYFGVPLAA